MKNTASKIVKQPSQATTGMNFTDQLHNLAEGIGLTGVKTDEASGAEDKKGDIVENLYRYSVNELGMTGLGDLPDFWNGMKDERVRRNYFDVVSSRYNVGDYETFNRNLSRYYDALAKSEAVLQQTVMDAERKAYEQQQKELKEQIKTQAGDLKEKAKKAKGEAMDQAARRYDEAETDRPWWQRVLRAAAESNTPTGTPIVGSHRDAYVANQGDVMAAEAAQKKAEDVLEMAEQYDRNAAGASFLGNFGRGLWNTVSDMDTWSGEGLYRDSRAVMAAAQKAERGEPLTEQEDMLLTALGLQAAAQEQYGDDLGRGYRVGEIAGNMVPFAAQFAFNPASKMGQSVMKAAARYAAKKFGTKGVQSLVKYGARVGGDVAGATLMATTSGAGRTAQDATQRRMGNARYATDENGAVRYDGTEGGESAGAAFGKALKANTIENFSEMMGNYFPAIGKLIGKSKPAEWLKATRVGKWADEMSASDFARNVADMERFAGWNGIGAEILEEEGNILLNAFFVGDNQVSDLWDRDQQLDIILGMAMTGGLISAARTGAYVGARYSANKKYNQANTEAERVIGEGWQGLKEEIDQSPLEQRTAILNELLDKSDLSLEQGMAVLEYARRRTTLEGVKRMRDKQVEEGVVPPVDAGLDEARLQGREAADGDGLAKHIAKVELDGAAARLTPQQRAEADAAQNVGDYLMAHPDQMETLEPYFHAKAKYEGLMEGVRETVEGQVQQAVQSAEQLIHSDGNVYSATLKADDAAVNILSGKVVMTPEGTLDREKSDKRFIVIHDQGRHMEMRPIEDIYEVSGVQEGEAYKEAMANDVRQKAAEREAAQIDGVRDFAPGEQFTVLAEGKPLQMEVVAQNQDGTVTVTDGTTQSIMPREELQNAVNEAEVYAQVEALERRKGAEQEGAEKYGIDTEVMLNTPEGVVRGRIVSTPDADGLIQVMTDTPVNGNRVNVYTAEQLDGMVVPTRETYKEDAEIKPIGRGVFGNIYDQFRGKAKEAIDFLRRRKEGEAVGALHHKDVGDIDLVWGNEGTGRSDGFGLAKLVKYHPEVLNDLQGIIDNMHVVSRSGNRINLESDTHKAAVRLEWDKEKKTWLLTAFEKENSVRDNTTDTGTTATGKQNDTATLQNTVSTNKGTQMQQESQVPVDENRDARQGEETNVTVAQEEGLQSIGENRWGKVYKWTVGKAKEAAAFLRKLQGGYLKGVFHRNDLGSIDLAWGNEKGGLKHIIQKHIVENDDFDSVDEAMQVINDVIANGELTLQKGGAKIEKDGYRVVLAKDENDNWVVTAYDYSRMPEDKKRSENQSRVLSLSTMDTENGAAQGGSAQTGITLDDKGTQTRKESQVPVDENGNPVYEKADPDAAWDDIVAKAGGDQAVAQSVAESMLADKQAALKKTEKAKPKGGTTVEEKIAGEKRRKEDIERARADVEAWKRIVETPKRREEAALAEETSREEKKEDKRYIDPRTMSDEEKQVRGERLRNAPAVEVETGQIVATKKLSARKAAEKWWDENVPEPVFYDTEVGEVEINRNSVESSLAHRYGQAKLDAITSLVEGFENAVYLGTMPDSRERGVIDNYFAYPINYNGKRSYVFCRAMQDANKNRLYVHEVFVADNIKEKGDTLQTAASKPHGGIALYKDILANVLVRDQSKNEKYSPSSSDGHLAEHSESVPDLLPTQGENTVSTDKNTAPVEESQEGNVEKQEETLTKEEAKEIVSRMEESAEVAPEMELTIENWDAEFGEDGVVNTPIGEVKMGENQFTKLMRQGREGKLGMVKPTLENPDVIIEDSSEAKEGDTTERGSSYVFVKAFVKSDGSRYYYFTSVTVSKDGREVVISNQEKRRNVLTNLLMKGKLVWKHADDVSTASDVADGLYSSQGKMSDPTTEGTVAPQTDPVSSTDKNTVPEEESQEGKKEKVGKQPHLLPKELRKAYESGEKDAITKAEKALRDYVEGSKDLKLIASTYLQSKDRIRGRKDKESPEYKVQAFIAKTCKDALMNSGIPVQAFQAARVRRDLAAETENPDVLDVLSVDPDYEVLLAVIHNPKTRVATLRGFTERFSNNSLDYEAQQAISQRKENNRRAFVAPERNDGESLMDYAERVDKAKQEYDKQERLTREQEIAREDTQNNSKEVSIGLRTDKIGSIDELTDEDFTTPSRNVELPTLPQNVADAIGTQGKPVVIKKSIFEKNRNTHPELTPTQSREILHNALYKATFVGQSQPVKRPNYWVAVQTADKNSITVLDVNRNKENVEIVGWRRIDAKGLAKLKRQAEREGGQFLILTSEDAAAALSALPSGSSSIDKGSEKKPADQASAAEKIEDVGEKIGGARKDLMREYAEREEKAQNNPNEVMEDLRSLPVSKIFNFDYGKLRKEGVSNEIITLLQVIRDIIPSKPRTAYKLKRWVSEVFELYQASLRLVALPESEQKEFLNKILEIRGIRRMHAARMALGGYDGGHQIDKAGLEELGDSAGHYDKEGKWVSIKGQWYVTNAGKHGGIYPTREKAEEALRAFAGENTLEQKGEKKTQFSVYQRRSDGSAYITVKGKPSIIVADGFKRGKDALEYVKEHYDELEASYRGMKDRTEIAFREQRPRKGRDWRSGRDISADEFRDAFGFRGVEFGNWTNQQDRQAALNKAYDALMDLAEAVGKSPRSLSLNGELGMAFGARGGGKASAHYEAEKVVINLTKTKGAGTLAHEWWHALDNYFSRRRGRKNDFNTSRGGYVYNRERGGAYSPQEREEVTRSFAELVRAIEKSGYGERSRRYASMKSDYWSRPTELGARAFAVWIERKLSEKGTSNDFLATNPVSSDWGDPEMVSKYYPYPIEGDFETLDTAFDNLFNAIEEKVDEQTGNSVLYRDEDTQRVNERFNEQLERYQEGELDKNEMFHLGNPSGVMRMFLPNLPIVMRQRVVTKGSNRKHDVDANALQDMPTRISEPIFVFKKNDGTVGILTEMKDRNGRNVFVAFDIATNIQNGGEYLEVNNVTTVHGRRVANVVRPILENNTLQWVDKEKALNWFSSASPDVQQEITSQELSTATKIVEEFENPKQEEGNIDAFYRSVYGGNSGYVGYSKSVRAVEAESRGLRNKSQMDKSFADRVNEILSENGEETRVTVSQIKRDVDTIEADEWHHTSMYGNRTNYYSPESVARHYSQDKLSGYTQRKEEAERRMLEQQSRERAARSEYAKYRRKEMEKRVPMPYDTKKGLRVEGAVGTFDMQVYDGDERLSKRHRKAERDEAIEEVKEKVREAEKEIPSYEQWLRKTYPDIAWEVENRERRRDERSIPEPQVIPQNANAVYRGEARQMAEELHAPVEFVTRESLPQGHRGAKGYYNPRTGKIAIVVENHTSVEDVRRTVFHEAVAHYGLRGLFGGRFNEFLDKAYAGASKAVREKIVEMSKKHGWNVRTATEEYLAELAERGFEQREEKTFWDKVKDLFRGMFREMKRVLGFRLTDNDLRYVLWKSYQKLRGDGGILSRAEDVVMRNRFGIGQSERERIVSQARQKGTYRKAPNGKQSRLTGEQWVTVRTEAFKRWFGDWEKAIRIEKLRKSKPVEVKYNSEYELNRKSAKDWMKSNIRGEYTNKDTGEKIEISKVGINEVTSHGSQNEAHLKSLFSIPQMIEQSVFIDELQNTKDHDKYDSYRYYVCGLKIGDEDYTAKIVVGVKDGNRYYDHRLTEIEKGTLIDNLNGLTNSVAENQNASVSGVKDNRLISILQTDASKIVDENGEPRVLYLLEGNTPLSGGMIPLRREAAKGTNAVFLNVRRPAVNPKYEDTQIDKLTEAGHDGIIREKDGEVEDIMVFYPQQVRDVQQAGENESIPYREVEGSIEQTNRRFNELLEELTEENADELVLDLGTPSPVLRAAGVEDKPMKLYGNKVIKKMKKHGFALDELRDLPRAVADPIAVFNNLGRIGNRSILTELKTKDGNFLVSIDLGKTKDVDFNIVSSIFGKTDNKIVNWINKGYATYVNKEKTLGYLYYPAPIAETPKSQELSTATKIVKDFENPRIEDENPMMLYREDTPPVGGSAREEYERRAGKHYRDNLATRVLGNREAWQDYMLGLKDLQQAVEKASGSIKDYEDAYTAENQRTSIDKAEKEFYRRNYFDPLMKAVASLVDKGKTYEEITRYMMAKHGLERNRVFALRDAREQVKAEREALEKSLKDGEITQEKYEKGQRRLDRKEKEYYQENRKRDYSGLTELTVDEIAGREGMEMNIPNMEAVAREMVEKFEQGNEQEVEELWKRVNAATKKTLKTSMESGVISKGVYDEIRSMFAYYVPLRGWNDRTAGDVYEYLRSRQPSGGATVRRAAGRESQAEDPIATIGMMADRAISEGNKNKVKQRFLNLALNRPSDLFTVRNVWYVKDEGANVWERSLPDIPAEATPEEVARIVEDHETLMKRLAEKGLARKSKNGLNIRYHHTDSQEQEHAVVVRQGGKEYVVYVNGNPRAAQALNGLTLNQWGDVTKGVRAVTRFMSANMTSRNPTFVMRNLMRDVLFSATAVYIKEDGKYTGRYYRNLVTVMPAIMRGVSGKENLDKAVDRYFKEFLENGGETGYTAYNTLEDYRKEIKRKIRNAKVKNGVESLTIGGARAVEGLVYGIEWMNRVAEDMSRFAVFMTSRQSGRSIQRSISDAKEVTVNFNRKGGGRGFLPSVFQTSYMFFNVSVQSAQNLWNLAKANPWKAAKAFGFHVAMGYLQGLLNDMLLSGDDDPDKYANLPDYIRQNSLCIYLGDDYFLTISLSPEQRPAYSLGESIYQATLGRGRERGFKGVLRGAVGSFAELLPINPLQGTSEDRWWNWDVWVPDMVAPVYEVAVNRNFFGSPIYKDNSFNKYDPQYTKAYAGTSKWLVRSSELLNEATGGDRYRRGWLDLNPAAFDHLLDQYFGGVLKTAKQTINSMQAIFDPQMRQARNYPVVSGFMYQSGERDADRLLNEAYYRLKREAQETERILSGYRKETHKGSLEYAEKLDSLYRSPQVMRMEYFKGYEGAIDQAEEVLKQLDGEDKEQVKSLLRMMKDELLQRTDDVDRRYEQKRRKAVNE